MTCQDDSSRRLSTSLTAIGWAVTTAWGSATAALYNAPPETASLPAGAADLVTRGFPFVLVGALTIHLITVWRAGRARAALAGAVGGIIGAAATASSAVAAGWVPELASEELAPAALAPAGVAMMAGSLIWLRALLAERGTWRYAAPGLGTGWE